MIKKRKASSNPEIKINYNLNKFYVEARNTETRTHQKKIEIVYAKSYNEIPSIYRKSIDFNSQKKIIKKMQIISPIFWIIVISKYKNAIIAIGENYAAISWLKTSRSRQLIFSKIKRANKFEFSVSFKNGNLNIPKISSDKKEIINSAITNLIKNFGYTEVYNQVITLFDAYQEN
ncbi:hypothetical protein ABN253_11855 [Proteus genomosp. 6]|uniref:Uncharacterized protein n=1 Tax=Proteus genomosp. 6 TaxID=1311820 RepID=A0ABV1LAW1_9GAMM